MVFILKNAVAAHSFFRYGYNLSECADGYEQCVNKSATPIPCDKGYYYDTSVFPRTVVTEVCENSFRLPNHF